MKKIKCFKCELYFKDRQDPEDNETNAKLCWNCRFIWKCIGLMLRAWPERINREVMIDIDKIVIRKKDIHR